MTPNREKPLRFRLLVPVLAVAALAAACLPPPPGAAPPPAPAPVTSSVSCAGTPVEAAIVAAFAGTGQEGRALEIAARESGCNPCAFYRSQSNCDPAFNPGKRAKGLFQLLGHDDLIWAACPNLAGLILWNDPVCGATAARFLFDSNGSWHPHWSATA